MEGRGHDPSDVIAIESCQRVQNRRGCHASRKISKANRKSLWLSLLDQGSQLNSSMKCPAYADCVPHYSLTRLKCKYQFCVCIVASSFIMPTCFRHHFVTTCTECVLKTNSSHTTRTVHIIFRLSINKIPWLSYAVVTYYNTNNSGLTS